MHIVAGIYKNRRLLTPKGNQTRPSASQLRESLFNICQNYIEGSRFLDLFAGSGAVGLEAMSRGASSATFVEKDREASQCIRKNAELLNIEKEVSIIQGDVFQALSKLESKGMTFDIIFADPPYQTQNLSKQGILAYSEKLILFLDKSSLLAPNGLLFIEEAFEFQPNPPHLKSLHLKSTRRLSSAALQLYSKPLIVDQITP